MNKKIIIGVLSAALALGGALSVGAANKGNTVVSNTTAKSKIISSKKAKEIALTKVHGKEEDIELKRAGKKWYYKVEIEKNHVDYDVYIDAVTGKIKSVHKDHSDRHDQDRNDEINKTRITISQSKAISIAKKAVNGTVKKVEKDRDNGIIKYEVELKTKKGKAEVEVNATTGKVIKVDYDNDDNDDNDFED